MKGGRGNLPHLGTLAAGGLRQQLALLCSRLGVGFTCVMIFCPPWNECEQCRNTDLSTQGLLLLVKSHPGLNVCLLSLFPFCPPSLLPMRDLRREKLGFECEFTAKGFCWMFSIQQTEG